MNTAYVFGAGSTKALIGSAPLMSDLLPAALRIMNAQDHPGHERAQRITHFLNDFYFYRPADTPIPSDDLPPFEDILSQIDLALEEGRPFSGNYDLGALAQLREDFVYAISEILRHTLGRGAYHHAPGGARKLLDQFMSSLDSSDCLISLNYDLVLDNALTFMGRPPSYGVPVRFDVSHGRPHSSAFSPLGDYDMAIPYLKLHGSLNWVYCPVCQSLDITGNIKGVRYLFEPGHHLICPVCQGRYEPLIVTPTLLKVHRNGLLRQIWQQAEDRLVHMDKVVFIGYSLPDADIHLRCMLKRALFRNRLARRNRWNGEGTCSITVVDTDSPPNPAFERYKRLFGQIDHVPDGFLKYIEHMRSE